MKSSIVQCVLVTAVAALAVWLGIEGRQRLMSDELPGEVGYVLPAAVPAPWADRAPVGPGRLRRLGQDEAAEVIGALRSATGMAYPCTAKLVVSVRKLTESDSTPLSQVPFRLDAQSAVRWVITSEEKQQGNLAVVREDGDLSATLPWEQTGYLCPVPSAQTRGPLSLPDELLDPGYILGVDDVAHTATFGALTAQGRLRAAYFTVDLETGIVRRLEVHMQNAPTVDRRYDFILIQEVKSVTSSEVVVAHTPSPSKKELLNGLEVPVWVPLTVRGN